MSLSRNLSAETMRQITAAGWQFISPKDTVTVRDRIVTAAQALSASLSAGEIAAVPDAFRDTYGANSPAPRCLPPQRSSPPRTRCSPWSGTGPGL